MHLDMHDDDVEIRHAGVLVRAIDIERIQRYIDMDYEMANTTTFSSFIYLI